MTVDIKPAPVLGFARPAPTSTPEVRHAPPAEKRFALSDKVTATATLKREYRERIGFLDGRRVWAAHELDEPITGIIVGERVLADGAMHYFGGEDPVEFRGDNYFRAYMVAFDLRRKPVLVRPEHLEVRL